jgi:competence protein ComEA
VGEAAKWQMLAWAVAAALVVFAVVRVFGNRQAAPAAAPVRIEGEARSGRGPARHGRAGEALYVHVAGAVRRPGLLRVPEGARVAAAVYRAGGATRSADLTAVNLAQPLEDGQQVIVPRRGAAPPAGGGAGSTGGSTSGASASAGAMPSLSTATAEQLEELDGIGPALAQRIVEYRESHGGFRSIDELGEVDGIGEKRLAALRKAVRP